MCLKVDPDDRPEVGDRSFCELDWRREKMPGAPGGSKGKKGEPPSPSSNAKYPRTLPDPKLTHETRSSAGLPMDPHLHYQEKMAEEARKKKGR